MLTYGSVGARAVELGMLTAEQARERLAGLADAPCPPEEVPDALVELGLGVCASADDVDDLVESYRDLLTAAAELTGAVTITDVRLDTNEDEEEVLRFRRDGEPYEWHTDRLSDNYLDHLMLFESFTDLDPGAGDPRTFHVLGQIEAGDATEGPRWGLQVSLPRPLAGFAVPRPAGPDTLSRLGAR